LISNRVFQDVLHRLGVDYYINRNLLEANGAQSLSISTSPEFQKSLHRNGVIINLNLVEANGAQSLSISTSPEFQSLYTEMESLIVICLKQTVHKV
jgi:hypothetical protein